MATIQVTFKPVKSPISSGISKKQPVATKIRERTSPTSTFGFMKAEIKRLAEMGKVRTSETYRMALLSFRRYRLNVDISLNMLSPEIIDEYQTYLQERGLTPNTTSFYMRILRAAYNKASNKGLITNRYPFTRVFTGTERTVKRALPLTIIRRISELRLTRRSYIDFARDMFMLSFYLRGMSFIDMAYLRKSDIIDGHITYRRKKTGQLLIIEWTQEMQDIISKYPKNRTEYLLPIITKPDVNRRNQYRRAINRVNTNLKAVGIRAKTDIQLSTYVARHSWASAAKEQGIPVGIISEGMGHTSEKTTRIYLASLDTSVIDRANDMILRALK